MILNRFPEILFASSKASDGNMDFAQGDPKKALENRKRFFSKFGIDLNTVIEVKQIHGNKVIEVTQNSLDQDTQEGDGLITNKANVYLMVKIADCHQIAVYDPICHAIALIHAGWRGLDKGIIKKTIQKMSKDFLSKPRSLIVQFGPSIGPCHYRMNIWKEAEDQLKENGVLAKNINNPKICTYHNDRYFSHRRAVDKKQNDFRFVTILGLKNAY